jgi:hypothetical protein
VSILLQSPYPFLTLFEGWHENMVSGEFRDNNKKVENPELLELIRLTIIHNLLEYHPVCLFMPMPRHALSERIWLLLVHHQI